MFDVLVTCLMHIKITSMPMPFSRIAAFSYSIVFNSVDFSIVFFIWFPKNDCNISICIISGLKNSHTWSFARQALIATLNSTSFSMIWFQRNVVSIPKTCIPSISPLYIYRIVHTVFQNYSRSVVILLHTFLIYNKQVSRNASESCYSNISPVIQQCVAIKVSFHS